MNFSIGHKFSILAITLSIMIILSFGYAYITIKDNMTNEFHKTNESDVDYILSGLQEALMASDYMSIFNILRGAINTTNIEHIKVKYDQYVFTKGALIYNSNYPKYLDWEVFDISTDARNGFIALEPNNMYKLYPTGMFNEKRGVNVKFALSKNGVLVNAHARMNFYYELARPNIDRAKIDDEQIAKTKEIFFTGELLGNLVYTIDDTHFNENIKAFQQAFWLYFIGVLVLVNSLLWSIYYIFINRLLLKPMGVFETNLHNALENNFAQRVEYKSGNKEFDNIIDLLNKILKRYTNVVNELNINKDILERKVFTDDLTGLQNQKVFELDLKNMFIVRADGFIATVKLESLGGFTKQFGSALANHLIEEFANTIQNKFYEFELHEATLYRFFGSEFAIIIKNTSEDMLMSFSENLVEEFKDIEQRYEIDSNLAKFAFIPFDKYGTIDSILHALSDAYVKIEQDGYFYIVSPSEVTDKFLMLEQSVKSIIENQSYEVTYGLNTTILETDELIMQEAIPILIDEKGEKFPIGVFISAAEKIGLSSKFDKYIVENVVNYINSNDIKHKIAINLSMFSLEDSEFLNWLHSLLIYNARACDKVVFSMTSYNASTNVEVFKNFVNESHRFGAKVILKRYTTNDFSLEDLVGLNIDYLRMHKDYTVGISDDRDKKHLLRNIVNFAETNNIILIGDSIKNQVDLKVANSIGLDAISNF